MNEKSYKFLSDMVYKLDPKHNDYDPTLKQGGIVKIEGIKYKILKVEDNSTNGMQAMAVAPIKNGKADTSEIVIAYAGTNSSDKLDLLTDTNSVIGGNKSIDVSKSWQSPDRIDGQPVSAQEFANSIKNKYPNASISTTGHSLGEFLALYIAAENGWMNVGFNGPDPYKLLSQEARDWIKKNPGMLFNYRNKADLIGNFGGNKTGAEILVDMGMGRNPKNTGDFHSLDSWKFDKKGRLIISDTPENKEARQIHAEKMMYAKILGLSFLAMKLKASGGGLSGNEAIFLDDSEALIAVESASESMKIGLESLIKIYQKAITEAEELWAEGLNKAQAIGTELDYYEVLDALAEGGSTKASIVDEPTDYYAKKIADAKKIGESFDKIVTKIRESIDSLIKSDKELASQME